jgi:hypothetical protein
MDNVFVFLLQINGVADPQATHHANRVLVFDSDSSAGIGGLAFWERSTVVAEFLFVPKQ